jgi:hypothetical protein
MWKDSVLWIYVNVLNNAARLKLYCSDTLFDNACLIRNSFVSSGVFSVHPSIFEIQIHRGSKKL